jgi:hypothetical protein
MAYQNTYNYKRLVAPVTYMVSSEDQVIDVDTTNGLAIIYVPNIQANATPDKKYSINDISNNAGTYPITINTIGGDLINNVTSLSLDVNGISAQIVIADRTRYIANLNTDDGGGGGGSTFINPAPTTIGVGGYPQGSTFPIAQTMQQMWDNLLYPYVPPAFSSFAISGQSTLIEVGIALAGIKTFVWGISTPANVQANSIAIRDVNTNVLLASGLPNIGSANANIGAIVNTSPISQNWRGEAVNSQLAPFQSGNFNVSSIYPVFYGKVASGGAPPGGNRPLSNQALINSGTKLVIPSGGTITLTFGTTADDYMWFAIPSTSPLKTIWYVNALNTGNIGGAVAPGGNLFPSPSSVSINSPTALWSGVQYDIYVANYQSGVILPMELRNS